LSGIFNTPTLDQKDSANDAMEFEYEFYSQGIHQIVVSLLCESRASTVMHMNARNTRYSVNNFNPADDDRILGAARASMLNIKRVNFKGNCRKYWNT